MTRKQILGLPPLTEDSTNLEFYLDYISRETLERGVINPVIRSMNQGITLHYSVLGIEDGVEEDCAKVITLRVDYAGHERKVFLMRRQVRLLR